MITKLGLLFVYDLETASAVYRNRISPDPIFLTTEASSIGGFYAINRRGQVLLATVNEATIVPFVSGQVQFGYNMFLSFFFDWREKNSLNIFIAVLQLNNLELAVNLAKRGNLPGAENLVNLNINFISYIKSHHADGLFYEIEVDQCQCTVGLICIFSTSS